MKRLLLTLIVIAVAVSCGGRKAKGNTAENAAGKAPKTFVFPKIPTVLTGKEEQAAYVAEHYWDSFDFRDTTNISNTDYSEQAFTDYVQFLRNIPPELAASSLGTLFKKASADKAMFHYFAQTADKYIFSPNSPYRDDELYILVLEAELANPSLDRWERILPEEQMRMALKNRVGTPAADFRYTLASGAYGTLYGIRSQYTLVFINNPGCSTCREIREALTASTLLAHLTDTGQLTVLAIYPDEDLEEWRNYAPNMPAEWINAYDKELKIKNEDLYDLKAIPTLYLLDREKKVMLKDVMSIPLIEDTIYKSQSN